MIEDLLLMNGYGLYVWSSFGDHNTLMLGLVLQNFKET